MPSSLRGQTYNHMKLIQRKPMSLREGGKDEWEQTEEYREKVATITKEVRDSYSTMLSTQKSWIGRLVIKLKQTMEIKRRISELSSFKNLHAIGGSSLLA